MARVGQKAYIAGNKAYYDVDKYLEALYKMWYEDKTERGNIVALELEKYLNNIEKLLDTIKYEKNEKGTNIDVTQTQKELFILWNEFSKLYLKNKAVELMVVQCYPEEDIAVTGLLNESELFQKGTEFTSRFVTDKSKSYLNTTEKELENLLLIKKDVDKSKGIQATFQEHIQGFYKSLNQKVDNGLSDPLTEYYKIQVAEYMNSSKKENKELSFYRMDDITGTYQSYFYEGLRNQNGKKVDAFMNHLANFHKSFYDAVRKDLSSDVTDSLDEERASVKIEEDSEAHFVQLLIDSLNSTSFLASGDVVIADENGDVSYNIQIKSVQNKETVFLLHFKRMKDTLNLLKTGLNSLGSKVLFKDFKENAQVRKFAENLQTSISNNTEEIEKKEIDQMIKEKIDEYKNKML